jgi:hypothetical protein
VRETFGVRIFANSTDRSSKATRQDAWATEALRIQMMPEPTRRHKPNVYEIAWFRWRNLRTLSRLGAPRAEDAHRGAGKRIAQR